MRMEEIEQFIERDCMLSSNYPSIHNACCNDKVSLPKLLGLMKFGRVRGRVCVWGGMAAVEIHV